MIREKKPENTVPGVMRFKRWYTVKNLKVKEIIDKADELGQPY